MCYECWTDLGKPDQVTPTISAATKLVGALYDFSSVGGNLHIVTDDWNLEDEHLASCRTTLANIPAGKPGESNDTDPAQVSVEAAILDAMQPMTIAERGVVLALHEGFIAAAA